VSRCPWTTLDHLATHRSPKAAAIQKDISAKRSLSVEAGIHHDPLMMVGQLLAHLLWIKAMGIGTRYLDHAEVGPSPELLPAIISVTLSSGARAMGKRGVIVRRLDAIENLGSMTILCTDKTGTLTEGTIVLSEVLDAASRPSDPVRQLA
jgi:high-affinity K+ transport system ATPase subunit B